MERSGAQLVQQAKLAATVCLAAPRMGRRKHEGRIFIGDAHREISPIIGDDRAASRPDMHGLAVLAGYAEWVQSAQDWGNIVREPIVQKSICGMLDSAELSFRRGAEDCMAAAGTVGRKGAKSWSHSFRARCGRAKPIARPCVAAVFCVRFAGLFSRSGRLACDRLCP